MNILLWVLQGVLAVKFASVAFTHGLPPGRGKKTRGSKRLAAPAGPLLSVASVPTLVGAVLVVLPAAVGVMAWITPWAAALLAVTMLAGVVLHTRCRERAMPAPGLILFAMSALVAFGRWAIAPL